MGKIKNFVNKYKSELIILLGAISSIAATLSTKEGVDAALTSALIAILAIVIEVVKNGITDTSITLLANAIKIIIEEIGNVEVKDAVTSIAYVKKDDKVSVKSVLTIEDIKKRLVE